MTPVILHVDMDAFFVSVEELYDPSLRGKPVIVGGKPNQRGVVAAASYAVRRFGVHSAMPLTQAARLCPQAIFLPVRHELYRKASARIREIFCSFSPQIDMVSVDEAYLNLSGCERLFGSPLRAAHLLHEEISREAGLACSIGASSSRLVSKIASDQAKRNGILWVMPGNEAAFLAPLPVGKIPGVGKVTEKSLKLHGVHTIGDMERWRTSAASHQTRSIAPQLGSLCSRPCNGTDSEASLLEEERDEGRWDGERCAKSIGHEETFSEDISDAAALDTVLANLSQRVASRLREQWLYARTITLKLRYASFQTITRAETMPESSNQDRAILLTARRLLRRHWNRKEKVRLLGIHASGLSGSSGQANLLTASTAERWSRVLGATDKLRGRFGFSSVQIASAVGSAADPKDFNSPEIPDEAGRQRVRLRESTSSKKTRP